MSAIRYVLFVTLLAFDGSRAMAEIKPDFMMDSDPHFTPIPVTMEHPRDLAGAWLKCLERPEVDMQRMAAESISLGHKKGVPGLQTTIPVLERIAGLEASHPVARFAAARALTVLDSRGSSDKMFAASQKYGADLRQLIEPVLAERDYVPIRAIWSERLEKPGTRQNDLILAIRGLGRVRDSSALPRLLKIVLDLTRPSQIRLEAASAAGLLAESGLDNDARRLASEQRSSPGINRHCAVRLLTRQNSEATVAILTEMTNDADPSLVARGLERLNEIDSALVLPLAAKAFRNGDVHVREQAAIAFFRIPTVERVIALAELLDDPHPGFRRSVCERLLELTKLPELGDTVRGSAMDVMSRDRWRGQEQAALLLGQLEFQPAWKRFVELLESPRPEVLVAAAWGLRKVAVSESIPAIRDKIQRQTVIRIIDIKEGLDDQVAHLFEACVTMHTSELVPVMMTYIPKQPRMGERSRSAAIWALGILYREKPDQELTKKLYERATDQDLFPPENMLVKRISVVSLGRLKAVEYAKELRRLASNDLFGQAIRWAVREITGEILPDPVPHLIGPGSWFLEPLDDAESPARP